MQLVKMERNNFISYSTTSILSGGIEIKTLTCAKYIVSIYDEFLFIKD